MYKGYVVASRMVAKCEGVEGVEGVRCDEGVGRTGGSIGNAVSDYWVIPFAILFILLDYSPSSKQFSQNLSAIDQFSSSKLRQRGSS